MSTDRDCSIFIKGNEMEEQKLNIEASVPEEMPWLRRLGGIIVSPRTTLGYLAYHPDWRVPFFLMLIATFISLLPIIGFNTVVMVSLISGTAGICLLWVFRTCGILLLAHLLRGKGKFYPLLSIIGYTTLPSLLWRIVNSSQWIRMTPVLQLPIAFSIISWAFSVWTLGLTILGISIVSKLRLWKAAIVVCLFVLLVLGMIFGIFRRPLLEIILFGQLLIGG